MARDAEDARDAAGKAGSEGISVLMGAAAAAMVAVLGLVVDALLPEEDRLLIGAPALIDSFAADGRGTGAGRNSGNTGNEDKPC